MAHKRGTTGSVRSKKARLKRASDLLHAAWDVLEPEDLSEARWGDLRNVITSVLAALRK